MIIGTNLYMYMYAMSNVYDLWPCIISTEMTYPDLLKYSHYISREVSREKFKHFKNLQRLLQILP